MATRTWYMMAGNWNDPTKWFEGAVPTAADDAVLQGSAACTITAAAVCRSLDANTYVGTLTHNASVTLTIGDSTAGAGNIALRLGIGMTYTKLSSLTSAITFASTSATQQTITTNGKAIGNTTFSTAGNWQLADPLTCSGVWTKSAGTWDSNSQLMTMTAGGTRSFNGGGATYNGGVIFTQYDALTLGGTNTFSNLTLNNGPSKVSTVRVSANQTILSTLAINANSAVNRPLFYGSVLGSPSTITAANLVITNVVDFQDIIGAGAATWTPAASGATYLGDCGGCSGITFTAPATQTWSGTSGGNCSANAWSGRVPLPQDDVVFNSAFSASQTITSDMPRMGKSISWVGSTGSPTWAKSALSSIYGSLTLISGMTLSWTNTTTFNCRSASTITTAGKTFSSALAFSNFGSSITLQDNLVCTSTGTQTDGTFDLNNNNATFTTFTTNTATTRSLVLGTGSLILTGTGTVLSASSSTGLTMSAASGTISVTDVGASSKTLALSGNKQFGTLAITTGGAGAVIITGTGSFVGVTVSGGSTKSITLPGSTTTTLTGTTPFPSGAAGNLLTFTASSGSATVSCANPVDADYLSLTNIVGAGVGIPLYSGTHSVNNGGNTNWVFTDRPVGEPSNSNMLLLM